MIPPIHILPTYAISLPNPVVALIVSHSLTWTNTKGLKYGRECKNVFTTMKIALCSL